MDDQSALIVQLALGQRLTRDAIVGAYALVVFDFLLMFARELQVIHKSRWTFSKLLYYGCRFGPLLCYPIILYGFVGDHDLQSCKPFLPLITFVLNLFPCFPQCIYTLRAWAFTGATTISLFLYVPCLLGYIAIVTWGCWYNLQIFSAAFLLGKAGCFRQYPQGFSALSWITFAGIGLDGIVGLTILLFCYRSHSPMSRLGDVLVNQGLLYYPLMISINAIAAVVLSIGNFRGYDALVFSTSIVLSNILACRFMIQIREYATRGPDSTQLISIIRRDLQDQNYSLP